MINEPESGIIYGTQIFAYSSVINVGYTILIIADDQNEAHRKLNYTLEAHPTMPPIEQWALNQTCQCQSPNQDVFTIFLK